jgi:pimeloyl-ACP methyl ester carboxylesterase
VTGLTRFHRQRPNWTPSDAGLAIERTSIAVPLDYSRPDGPEITISFSRRRATRPEHRRGVLVAMDGGPGGNEGLGLAMPTRFDGTPLNEIYDIVGFDPRGYGESTPLTCDEAPKLAGFDSRPPDTDFALIAADMRAAEEACQRSGGELRRHVNTRNIARDLDVIRAVLRERRITYVGFAYGTYVGAVYGTLFPQRLSRTVLDSCVHPDWVWRKQFMMQAAAIRSNVDEWAGWVGERHSRFGLGRSAAEVLAAVEEIAAKLDAEPADGMTRTAFDGAVGNGAASRPGWAGLADLVAGLSTRTTGSLAATAAVLVGQGLRPGTHAANTSRVAKADEPARPRPRTRAAALEAVTCEAEWPEDLEVYYADMRHHRESYPYGFGVLRAQPWVGTFRTFTPPEPVTEVRREGYPRGLVVHAMYDPMDHYQGAVAMAERLGHHLITVLDDGGHKLYPTAGNEQVNAYVTRYLMEGVRPGRRVTCPGAPRPDIAADAEIRP